jgi:hypothetical protein
MSFELILPFLPILRPIEPLLPDESVSEIIGNPDASWFYVRDGILCQKPNISFDASRRRTNSAEKALRRFANLVMRDHAQTTFSDAEAEIGEAVDFVSHVERRPGRRILREVLALRGYDRDAKRFLIEPVFQVKLPQQRAANGTSTAADLLPRCFASVETIALLVRRTSPNQTLQRIAPLERALAPRYLGWLAHENSTGENGYVDANPLRRASRKRTKECIAGIRHLYLDLNTNGEARLSSLRTSDAVAPPNAILSTSLRKYQFLWRVDGFAPEQLNRKCDPACQVTVEYPGDSTWNSEDFRLDFLAADAILAYRSTTPRKHPANLTNSEHDWAWVFNELARGKDAARLTRKLASRRADKPNPIFYAQGTVDVASARLWLIEGVPIDDVVAMLDIRRRFEIPAALCSARAREIALTAQTTIARRKVV